MRKQADTASTDRQTAAATTIETSNATTCVQCDSYVTRDYHRVFSDNDGELHGCLDCGGHGVPQGGRR